MDKTLRMSLLFDFYGPLLTKHQQDIYERYFHEDLSLGEISEQLAISRQAVYDILKRSAHTLEEFEAKLGLIERHQRQRQTLEDVQRDLLGIREMLKENSLDFSRIDKIMVKLRKMQTD